MRDIADKPDDLARIHELQEIATLVLPLPLGLNLAEVQNTYWSLKLSVMPQLARLAVNGDQAAAECLQKLTGLGEHLGFAPGALQVEPAPESAEHVTA